MDCSIQVERDMLRKQRDNQRETIVELQERVKELEKEIQGPYYITDAKATQLRAHVIEMENLAKQLKVLLEVLSG